MKYDLIATDFDNTFARSDGSVSQRNKKAVNDYISLGGKFIICTGRMLKSAISEAKSIGLKGDVIAYNGAMVADIESGRIKHHDFMERETVYSLLEDFEDKDVIIHIYVDDVLYVKEVKPFTEFYCTRCKVECVVTGEKLSEFLKHTEGAVTKVLIIAEPQDITKFYNDYSQRQGVKYAVTSSTDYFLEFTDKKVSKGRGVCAMAESYGIDKARIACFGDARNDISMIEYAGFGVAVQNAHDEVKKRADYVTLSNDEDGVACVIEKIIKGEENV